MSHYVNSKNLSSWILKPCTDEISYDVRPSKRYRLNLPKLIQITPKDFTIAIATPAIAILYTSLDDQDLKITLYQSGRMLIENRDKKLIKSLVIKVMKLFNIIPADFKEYYKILPLNSYTMDQINQR
ncbi:MAG: hypothetical protein ACXAC7_21315 [Candidatus Hodarchaeales archaeon]|jgi:hypothetical protein